VQVHPDTVTATILQETITATVKSALAVEAPGESIHIALVRDLGVQIAVARGPQEIIERGGRRVAGAIPRGKKSHGRFRVRCLPGYWRPEEQTVELIRQGVEERLAKVL
jgi:hypothetical protein